MHFDIIFRNGEIIDGSGSARFRADLGVSGERIAAIGDLASSAATRVVDAQGQIVAPGFIDSHTHDDAFVLSHPDVEPKVCQGVTTVIAGNCGISLAPLCAGRDVPQPLDLLGAWQTFRFPSFGAYLDALDATPAAVNTAALVGHSTLRVRHMADLGREASAAEIAAMAADVREATLWLLFAISFLYNVGNYGLVFWMPTMIKALGGLSNFVTGVISAVPYLVASFVMVLNAQHSVRTGERRWHTATPVVIGGIALLASVGVHAHPVLAVACLTVGVAGIMSTLAMFWSLPSRILAGEAAAGGAGLVNIGAAVAGFVGPSIMGYLKGLTGSTEIGIALLALTLFAAAALILSIPRRYMARA